MPFDFNRVLCLRYKGENLGNMKISSPYSYILFSEIETDLLASNTYQK